MKEKSEKESENKKKKLENIAEEKEELMYEKLLIIGEKNVGKLSLIENLFTQDSNIITSENDIKEKENKENIDIKKEEKEENSNIKKEEEKKDNEQKKEENIENNENNKNVIKERNDEEKDLNNNNINKKENLIIYEKKIQMKNGTTNIKYFQIFVTSFCDINLIHSLSFMCQCILVLFDVKNKISYENSKKIINIMDKELKSGENKIILVSTKNDQDSQNKEIQNINPEEVNNFLNEIKEKRNNDNKYGISMNKFIEISNNTKRGINNLRTEILNSYDKDIILHKPLLLGFNSDFIKLKSEDIYDKFNSASTEQKTISNNNNTNNINIQDNIIETISPKYLFKLEKIKYIDNNKNKFKFEETLYENIKIILIGDTQVGKTSFLNQFFSEGFNINFISTIGITERSKILHYKNKVYKIQIWDTAGQERFESIPKQYYEKIEGVFLFYDVTNEQSFDNMSKWLKDIFEGGHKDLIVYILGNKVDLIDERKVNYETGLNFAKNKNIKFMEISCKLDLNVSDVVYCMIYDILKIDNYCYSNRTKSFSLEKPSIHSRRNRHYTNRVNNNTQNNFHEINNSNNDQEEGCCF